MAMINKKRKNELNKYQKNRIKNKIQKKKKSIELKNDIRNINTGSHFFNVIYKMLMYLAMFFGFLNRHRIIILSILGIIIFGYLGLILIYAGVFSSTNHLSYFKTLTNEEVWNIFDFNNEFWGSLWLGRTLGDNTYWI